MKMYVTPSFKTLLFTSLAMIAVLFSACDGEEGDSDIGNIPPPVTKKCFFTNAGQIRPAAVGDSVYIEIGTKGLTLNKVEFLLNNETAEAIKINGGEGRYWMRTKGGHLGANAVTAKVTLSDQTTESISINIYFISDIVPEKMKYVVLQEFEHDPTYYTQGLVYQDGWLYEGTGLTGESKLACYNLQTREIKHEIEMDKQIFGEGITLLDGMIYQITYQSGKVFVYDQETFAKVKEHAWYSEGWGLTTNGKELILSDGSATLYFLDPNTFTEVRKIQIADNKGSVQKINELEYVDGLVYANIWQSDRIIVIDPESGKVLKEVDMSGILPSFDSQFQQDFVLNGIAYNPETTTFVITGKKWPKMFEVTFLSEG